VIDEMKAEFGVGYLAGKFGVSESGYHQWRSRPRSGRELARWELDARVWRAFSESGRADGHRKIAAALNADAMTVDRKTVAGSMRRQGLLPPAAEAAFRRAAARARIEADPADLLNRDFTAGQVGAALVSDITYVRTGQGWVYLATVIDLASRMVLGYATGKRQTAALVITALQRAISSGHIQDGAIFHSDHGVQYRSKRVRAFCRSHGLRQSMGARFECWDNAVAEGFFSRLKTERLNWIELPTRAAAYREIADYIRHFNTARRHQHLGYQTPELTLQRLTNTEPPAATAA